MKPTCSFLKTQYACSKLKTSCKYENNICKQVTCEDFVYQDQCSTIFDLKYAIGIQCMFIQNRCINPTIQQLNTQDLCSNGTLDTYAFINGSCQECELLKSNPDQNTSIGNGAISNNGTATTNTTLNGTSNGTENGTANGATNETVIGNQTRTQKAIPTGHQTGYLHINGTQTDSTTKHIYGKLILTTGNFLLLYSQ